MAKRKGFNAFKTLFDIGLGPNYPRRASRIINKDGTFNVRKKGMRTLKYQALINMPRTGFYTIMVLAYFGVNLIFTFIYLAVGIDQISNVESAGFFKNLLQAFFFSIQTFTTVGYGNLYPASDLVNWLAGVEAMCGWIFFALATGLVYGRFSRPSARILFSDHALMTRKKNGYQFNFRIVNRRPNVLVEMHAKLMLAMDKVKDGNIERVYYSLSLKNPYIHFFPLNWTIIHEVKESSPMYNMTAEELEKTRAEFLILIRAFDETFSQNIHIPFSYTHDEIVWNAAFDSNFHTAEDGYVELDIDKVHDWSRQKDLDQTED
jgi:inward rectifier potassium channel